MYKIIKQRKDNFLEVVEDGIFSREEAEYILAELVLRPEEATHSFYIERSGHAQVTITKTLEA